MIKEKRKAKKYTQEKMSEILGISLRQYIRIDNEEDLPSLDNKVLGYPTAIFDCYVGSGSYYIENQLFSLITYTCFLSIRLIIVIS